MANRYKDRSKRLAAAAMLLALAALSGCGRGGLRVVPADWTVTLDGQPVAEAAVVFVSVEGGHVAHGVTDAQGRFMLTTTNMPGAVPGEHRVGITKQNIYDPTLDGGIGELRIDWLVPQRYSSPDTSGLTATVPARGARGLQFDLTSR